MIRMCSILNVYLSSCPCSGVPAIVDFAVMRDAVKSLGGDPSLINPVCPADLVIDHSVQVDYFRRCVHVPCMCTCICTYMFTATVCAYVRIRMYVNQDVPCINVSGLHGHNLH